MLYIFDSAEKLITTLPKGGFFDAVHREVLNVENTFVFTIPAGSEYVVEGNLVAFKDLDNYWQVFEIKRLVDLHGDSLTRTVYCEHILYELLDDIVTDRRPSADATAALAGMLDGTRWQVGIVDDLGASSTSAYYVSALEAVQNVANAWKGELNWRCVISGGVITRYVDLLTQRGTDTGKQFAYSKDILNIEREVDSSGVVTALYGRGKGIELDSGAYGRRLTFADVEAPGKPLGQEWIGDNEALAQWGRPGGRHRFDVFIDEEETDPVALLEKTRAELARRKVPRVTYRLDVVSLEQLTGYEHEKVRLGDMVRVIDREFKPDLVVSARVVELERDILDPANTKVVLGSFAPTIVEATINTARRVNEMANRPFNTKWLDGKISVLQNAIENTQSYVFQTGEDGILILDAPTYDQATKAMKLGGGIFAIANQKDGLGGWNWRTFGDGSGFSADLITAGMIDAGLVRIGSATTFEAGYDPTQITANSVGMGVDADCLGLWHFDGSLNSHKGVAVESNADYNTGLFGQALNIATGKHLKVPAAGLSAGQGTINLRVKNLASSPNNSVLIEAPQPDNSQGIKSGIASDGRLYVQDLPSLFKYVETTQADFNSGTLTDVVATSAGDLQLATGKKLGTREKVIDLSSVGANNYGSIINFTKTDAVVTNATFTRASVAYLEDGTEVEAGQPRFEVGKFDKAVLVEEGTTNLLTANQASVETDTTGFSTGIGAVNTATFARDTSKAWHGNASLKVDTSGSVVKQGVSVLVSGTANAWYAGIVHVWAPAGVQVRVGLWDAYYGENGGDFVAHWMTITGNSAWQEVKVVGKMGVTNTTGLQLFICNPNVAAISFYIDGLQIEQKTCPTSWQLPGTARAPEVLTIPTAGVIDTQKGTIAMWVKMGKNSSPGPSGVHDNYISLNAGIWAIYQGNGQANALRFTVGDTWGTSTTVTVNIAWDKDDLLFIVPSWDLPNISLTVYNYTKGTTATTTATGATYTATPTLAHVNCGDGSAFTGYTNSILDELAIFNYAATAEEIAAWYNSDEPMPFQSGCTYKMDFDNNLQATVGTVDVEAALSVDGGDNYGQYSEIKSGLSIPGLACDTDLTNGRLKIKETLYTSDDSVTPKLHDLSFNITKKLPTTVYGPNKSTLTGWDSISLAWEPERLSLVVNDEEACYIENPGLPASLGSHVFIGTDRNGANTINTLVDELRIDKVYREVAIRTAWHKVGSPFYTTEDMKQWPGYIKIVTDGVEVYDSEGNLRVKLGSWLKDLIRKYGLKIVGGEIHSSKIWGTEIRTGSEGDTSYAKIGNVWGNPFEIVFEGKPVLQIWGDWGQGRLIFFDASRNTGVGRLEPMDDDAGTGFRVAAMSESGLLGVLGLMGSEIKCTGNLSMYSGTKYNIEQTENYGQRGLAVRESPEQRYIDEGVGTLVNGECRIDVDPIFMECIEPHSPDSRWYVQFAPYADVDLYVSEIGDGYFIIKERKGGTSTGAEFAWSLSATRKDYAMIRFMEVLD